jgi:hypothetical protein
MAASQASLRIRNGMRSRTALEGSRRLVATPTLPELTARQYWGTYVRIRCSSDMARDRSREELRPARRGRLRGVHCRLQRVHVVRFIRNVSSAGAAACMPRQRQQYCPPAPFCPLPGRQLLT